MLLALSVAAGCASPERHRMGETFDLGSVSYTVKGREVRSQLSVGGSTMESGRSASFVLITYTVANHGKDYAAVNPLMFRLLTADRTRYDVDLPATYALRMETMLGGAGDSSSAQLAAGGSGTYVVVFRVPDDVARGRFSVTIGGRAVVEIG